MLTDPYDVIYLLSLFVVSCFCTYLLQCLSSLASTICSYERFHLTLVRSNNCCDRLITSTAEHYGMLNWLELIQYMGHVPDSYWLNLCL